MMLCFVVSVKSFQTQRPLMIPLLVGIAASKREKVNKTKIKIQPRVDLETANEWLFQSISLLVKSADLCRCDVEIEAGNDGLEGELRQRAEEERLLWERHPCGRLPADADVS